MADSPKKLGDYRHWYHFLRRSETVPGGPLYINIEPTNACNLKCSVCSTDGTRRRGYMDLDLFRRLVDEARDSGVQKIALFLAGEPLLHKDIAYMVRYVVERGMEARIRTNATMLTPEKSEALLDAGLDFLGISFDGDNKQDYEAIRVGADYDHVLENVFNFLRLKKQKGLAKPFVSLQMIKLVENPKQGIDSRFVEQFAGLPIDEFSPINPHNWRGEKDDIEQRERGRNYFPCQFLWSALSVAWDGKVVCCADLNGQHALGDVTKQTLEEIWNGEPFRRHRRLLKEGRNRDLSLCADCHAVWYYGNPRLFILSHLPPFEQLKKGFRRIHRPRQTYMELLQKTEEESRREADLKEIEA
ncbi:MAG: radical SAM protein [Thermoleophilia bacterium]|nr:radical SAM protein [Thermoleophilia bacterium]